MKEINSNKTFFNSMTELFDGKTEFVIVRSGETMDLENDIFVGHEAGTTKDPYVAHICDTSKIYLDGDGYGGCVWRGDMWRTEHGKKAYDYNKKENPDIFIYEATNVKTGEKIKFSGQKLLIKDIYDTNYFKLSKKINDGYKILEFLTNGEIAGEQVVVKIVPRIIKLTDEEIAELNEKAQKRKENTIKRIMKQIEEEKEAIKRANEKITKLEEKLAKLEN